MRNQPIYNNEKLKNAGKYSFETVNAANRRQGEMIYDSTIKTEEPKSNKKIVAMLVVSCVLIIITCFFAFTDLKYLIIPKKDEIIKTDPDFEASDIIHELTCDLSYVQDGLTMSINKIYGYNNNKVKTAKYTYTIEVSNEKLINDSSFYEYISSSFDEVLNNYKDIDGLELIYEESDNNYKLTQIVDLSVLDTTKTSQLTDVTLDQKIDVVKTIQIRKGLECK